MKTISISEYYKCEFCNKSLIRKSAMINHEDNCYKNPKNIKPCFSCEHLGDSTIIVHFINENPEFVRNEIEAKVFRCTKLDKFMFPFSIERRKLHVKYSTYDDQSPMPNECKDYLEIKPF